MTDDEIQQFIAEKTEGDTVAFRADIDETDETTLMRLVSSVMGQLPKDEEGAFNGSVHIASVDSEGEDSVLVGVEWFQDLVGAYGIMGELFKMSEEGMEAAELGEYIQRAVASSLLEEAIESAGMPAMGWGGNVMAEG